MPTLDEQEHLVQEFCKNTSASERLAREVLNRNGWVLSTSYKEVEQMCVSGNRSSAASMHPPYRHPYKEPIRPQVFAMASRGGTEGGIGPAVSLDLRGIRPPARYSFGDNIPQSHPMQGLKVALPPVTASVERIIPIHVEGGRTVIPAQTSAQGSSKWANPPSVAMARVTLNEKVLPSQPSMVAPTTVANTNVSNNDRDQASSEFSSAVDSRQLDQSSSNSLYNLSESCYPRLKRGFSNIIENESIVIAARTSVLHDIKEDNHQQMFSTFMLPDITIYTEEFTQFLNKELIESSTLNSLQMAGRLNWWADQGLCQRLIPMATTGDGNCLLHAASLAMWGIHDRQLTLRNALHHTLTKASYKDYLCRRWRWQQTLVNQQSGLVFSEAEWKAEWENILRLASPSPRSGPDHFTTNINSCCDSPVTHSSVGQSDPVVYESLEEFHVFVLAHVLKRPIIVVADTILRDANGDALAPIPFGGIYLPLECISKECCLSPLLLTYDAAHFSALVPMQNNSPDSVPWAIPVMDPQLQLLPLHFWHDPGPQFDWSTLNNKTTSMLELCQEDRLNLLKQYMDIIQLPFCPDSQLLLNNNPLTGRQPSSGSEEGTSLNCGTVKKDKKEGKGNSVAKQFGSLGKSVGKKLKNLGNNLAPGKPGKSSVEGEKGGGSLSGGLSQSAKVITAVATTGSGEKDDWVYCAKLMLDHLPEADFGRQQFINNYLKDAQRRFQEQEQKRQQKAEELRAQLPAAPPPYSR